MERIGRDVKFGFWEKYDEGHTVVRFATSWGKKMEEVRRLVEVLP